jgi:hypothetical protein
MDIIKQSIINYDKMLYNLSNKYKSIKSIKFIDETSDLQNSVVIINGDKFNYNVLGRFDNSTNFWEWGWSFEKIKNKTYDLRQLFLYGIENYDDDYKILRDILINSRIKIDNKLNLEIILGISLSFLNEADYQYILKIDESSTITKFIII